MDSNRVSRIGLFHNKKVSTVLLVGFSSALLIIGICFAWVISSPSNANALPDLKGLSIEQVNELAGKADIPVTFEWINSSIEKGLVTEQVPAAGEFISPGKAIRVFISKGLSESSTSPSSKSTNSVVPEPEDVATKVNEKSQPSQKQNTNSGLTEQQRKAQIAKQRAEADAAFAAEMAERKRLFDEQQAAVAAEQARIAELNTNYYAAYEALSQARSNYQYWEAQTNSFASRGMLDSGAGSQASAARNQAQIDLAIAEANLAAAQAARDAG